jgi:hypothetical protein
MGGSMEEKKESTVRGGVRGWVEAERLRVNLVVGSDFYREDANGKECLLFLDSISFYFYTIKLNEAILY